jgi:hypothetical protein
MGNACIEWITKMGADDPIPPNTFEHRRPRRDAPAAIQVQFSYKRDSQKNALPSEAPPRRPSDPIRGGNIINKFLVTYFTHMKQ